MLHPSINRLTSFSPLSEQDARALGDALRSSARFGPKSTVAPHNVPLGKTYVLTSGVAACTLRLAFDRRQIISFMVPGDGLDCAMFEDGRLPYSIETIGPCTFSVLKGGDVEGLLGRPAVANALRLSLLCQRAMLLQSLVSLGRRTTIERLAHWICEYRARLVAAGVIEDNVLPMPMTQIELADALGISTIHTNRAVGTLRKRGLIAYSHHTLTIVDFKSLSDMALFSPDYLYALPGDVGDSSGGHARSMRQLWPHPSEPSVA